MQSTMAVIFYLFFIFSRSRITNYKSNGSQSPKGKCKRQKHTEILLATLVEFQKVQCYFNISLQIATMISIKKTPIISNIDTR